MSTRLAMKSARFVVTLATIAVFVVGSGYGVKWFLEAPDRNAKEWMERHVQHVLTGREKSLWITNDGGDVGIETFLERIEDLKSIRDLDLAIEYSHNTDSFLEKIRGLDAVRVIQIHRCDVSDAGLGHIATLPHLESLGLFDARITDAGIENLAKCPTLKSLGVKPNDITQLSVRTIAALPNIERLSLYEPYEKDWLKQGIEQIDNVSSLKELSLYQADLSPEDVAHLRARLPNCKVRAFLQSSGGGNEEIASLSEDSQPAVPRAR